MGRFTVFYTTGKYNLEEKDKEEFGNGKRLPQYAAALTASMAAFSLGTVLAWTSPASPHLLDGSAGFPVTVYELSLIGSLMPIGAAVSCAPTGFLTDRIGRKMTLLCSVPVCLVGWALIIWAANVEMLYAGRLITGMYGGAICVTCPVFIVEISHKAIRGELVSLFELLLAAGITIAFLIGSQLNLFYYSLTCGAVPIIFGGALVFFPETPVYYLTKGRPEDALKSLKFYRGEGYDAGHELCELAHDSSSKTAADEEESAMDVFLSKPGLRAFFISLGLMAFQQLCGINATTFYSTTIFQDAGTSLEPNYATVVVGFMQFAGTFVETCLSDRLGRIPLLGSSAIFMALSMFSMGTYFYAKEMGVDTTNISWIPVLFVCTFTVMFAVGYGPIPWALMPEVIPSRIVGSVSSIACIVNWVCAFLVTKFFSDLVHHLGTGITFWLYAVVSGFAVVFTYKALPETKGKSLEEIQKEMSL